MKTELLKTTQLVLGYNPRKHFDITDIKESIKKNGLLVPLLVRPKNGKYEIVSGQCRFNACKELGLKEIHCIIRELSDEEASNIAYIDNKDRNNLSPIEIAKHYSYMRDKYKYTAQKLADEYGISKSEVSQFWMVATLPDILSTCVDRLSFRHLYAISKLVDKDKLISVFEQGYKKDYEEWNYEIKRKFNQELEHRQQEQLNFGHLIVEEDYSVRQTEQKIKAILSIFKKRDDTIRLEFEERVNRVYFTIKESINNAITVYKLAEKESKEFVGYASMLSDEFLKVITEDKKEELIEELIKLEETLKSSDSKMLKEQIKYAKERIGGIKNEL